MARAAPRRPWAGRIGRLLTPSMVDIFFVALLMAAFVRPGWQQLLADGDTGWHIRTGQLVLAEGRAPRVDRFSFTRPGERWCAWEWLSDAAFALMFAAGGLAAVAKLAGAVLCLAAAVVFAWLLRRGSGLWIALAVTLAAVNASSVHYLARPHVFSILLYAVSLWILDEAGRGRPLLLWMLPPLCALWANLHAGFVVLPATLLLAAAVDAARRRFHPAWRYLAAAMACLAASLLNPYGWKLDQHILSYLRSPWILNHVQEFQSPDFRSEGTLVFAILLLGGAALASRTIARGNWFEGILALAWGFAALRSARHIPLFAMAVAPVIADECARWWRREAERAAPRSPVQILWQTAQDLGCRGATVWLPVLGAAAAMAAPAVPIGFPADRFPVQAVERNAGLLAPAGRMPRVLTSDQWADYLIYRFYPRERVFFDGRSDFYGPRLGADYSALQTGAENWRALVARYRFDLALLPRAWPLDAGLAGQPGWQPVYEDSVAVLYRRTAVRRRGER